MELFKLWLVTSVLGLVSVEGGKELKILAGANADVKTFPFIGVFRVLIQPFIEYRCTGSLVDQKTAITAARCVVMDETATELELLPLTIYYPYFTMGVSDITRTSDPFYTKRPIIRMIIHPKAWFDPEEANTCRFDLGAVKWEEKIVLNRRVQLIPLIPDQLNPVKVIDEVIKLGTECDIPGWGESLGKERRWKLPDILQSAKFKLMSKDACCQDSEDFARCTDSLGARTGILCYYRVALNTGQPWGDSGSPVVCPSHGKAYLVGLVASGIPSDRYINRSVDEIVPGFYSDYLSMVQFIRSVAPNSSELANTCQKECSPRWIQILAVFTWSLLCL